MIDIVSKSKRSAMMAGIKNKDTKPEILVRKELYGRGFRYRKNYRPIFGSPDIFVLKYNVAIFVHGCFWHQHANCKFAYMPKSNVLKWQIKFDSNSIRDELVKMTLASQKIRMIIVWECSLKNNKICKTGALLSDLITNDQSFAEISYSDTIQGIEVKSG